MAINLNPAPTQGTGNAFGAVPGSLSLPDPFSDLNKAAGGGLGALNKNLLTDLTANSLGILSPGARNALQLTNAQTASGSGMPLSGLSDMALFGNVADYSNKLQQQAFQNYNALIPTISKTQTVDPALQTEISNVNALRGAAPSPQAQFNLAKSLYDEYAAKVRGPGGGTSFGPQPSIFPPVDRGPAGGIIPPDNRQFWDPPPKGGPFTVTGNTVGGGGVGLPASGVPVNTGANPVTDTSNFDPFGGFGSFFAGPTGQGYGASEPAAGQGAGYTYMGPNPDAGQAGGAPDLSSIGIDDALAQVFGL